MALLTSPVRRQILEVLTGLPVQATPEEPKTRRDGLTAAELGARIGLHLTTIRFHVDQLLEAGLVLAHDISTGVGRPKRHYAANPGGLAELNRPDGYHMVAEMLADAFAAAGGPTTAEEAAERWVRRHSDTIVPEGMPTRPARTPGQFLGKIGALVDVLESWGYSASVATRDEGHTADITLRTCPIRDLATSNPAIACGLHRGLVCSALDVLGEGDTDTRLVPFSDDGACIAHVTTHQSFSNQEARP
jgi:predicted ArsR family transcriptional regulator